MEKTALKTKTIKTEFIGGAGYMLDARIERPIDTPNAYAVASHCFTCTKDTITVFRISRLLAERGIAVLRFDFTGLGNSEGDFAQTNFTTDVADALAAVEFLRENYEAPSLLIGHSLGGTAMLEAAINIERVKAVVTIASPSQPDHVLHHFGHALTLLEQGIASSIEVAGRHYDIEPQFITDLRQYDMQQRLASLAKPVLIFKVLNDALVDSENADEINAWTRGPSRIVTLDKADHLLSNKEDAAFVADEIVRWFNKL
jgi:alpha/beta superfamily hydrolase